MRIALLALCLSACAAPLPAPIAVGAPFGYPLRMVGTEPFWGAVIHADRAVLSGADRPERAFPVRSARVTGAGARWDAGAAVFTVVRETCSDGMSDRVYPFAAEVVVGGETLKGCAIPERLWSATRP